MFLLPRPCFGARAMAMLPKLCLLSLRAEGDPAEDGDCVSVAAQKILRSVRIRVDARKTTVLRCLTVLLLFWPR